jgi:hypothetical protein
LKLSVYFLSSETLSTVEMGDGKLTGREGKGGGLDEGCDMVEDSSRGLVGFGALLTPEGTPAGSRPDNDLETEGCHIALLCL